MKTHNFKITITTDERIKAMEIAKLLSHGLNFVEEQLRDYELVECKTPTMEYLGDDTPKGEKK